MLYVFNLIPSVIPRTCVTFDHKFNPKTNILLTEQI